MTELLFSRPAIVALIFVLTVCAETSRGGSQEPVQPPMLRQGGFTQIRKCASGHEATHYSWMDEMRNFGVKRMEIEVDFIWRNQPTDLRPRQPVYFALLTDPCSQIIDPKQLQKIRDTGLEQRLLNAATRKIEGGEIWTGDWKPKYGEKGIAGLALYDDDCPPPPSGAHIGPANRGLSPLAEAAANDDQITVARLLASSRPTASDKGTALLITSQVFPCIARLLVESGADVNYRDSDRHFTPLIVAAASGQTGLVEFLLRAGADVNARGSTGQTALSEALRRRDTKMVEILRRAGARE